MSENKIDVDLTLSEKKFDLSLGTIFLDSLKLLKKTIFPTLIFIFLLTLIIAGLNLLILTGAKSTILEMGNEYKEIVDLLSEDPDYVLSDELNTIYRNYPTLFLITNIAEGSLLFFILLPLLMISIGKIYSLYYEDEDAPSTWIKSISKPFNSGKRALTSAFIIIFGSVLISTGFSIFIIPGILVIYSGIFSIHSLIIDEKEGMETIRGGLFYVKGFFAKLIIILTISIFIPMLIQYLFQVPFMELIGLTENNYETWINPTTRNLGMLYIYNFTILFTQSILFFLVPVIYTVAFVQIRDGKLGSPTPKRKFDSKFKDKNKNIIIIEIEKNQKHFNCPNCGKKLPSSSRKCYKCKQLFDLKFK
ncbi:hypothetical protein DSAG12_02331 [Promethearchaeum syntrophicum]|uniref:Uncharacterized protein n=1 Tax=Promethearchaeum syntrophicum TaxID=2594042 RepID=A0A5B9DBU1_9ARCH